MNHQGTGVIRGHVRTSDKRVAVGVLVRAFDRALRDEIELGKAITGPAGEYEIDYAANKRRRSSKSQPDLIVRAVDPVQGTVLGSSKIVFRAGPVETIELELDSGMKWGLSDYDHALGLLEPELDGMSLSELHASEIAFLAGATGLDAKVLAQLVLSAQWVEKIGVPAEVVYALLRHGFPTDLEAFLAVSREQQRAAILDAIATNAIPATAGAKVDSILDQLQRALVAQIFEPPDAAGSPSIGTILGSALPSLDQKTVLATALTDSAHTGKPIWETLRDDPRFLSDGLSTLQYVVELSAITQNHGPVVEALVKRVPGGTKSIRDLAGLRVEDWIELVTATPGAAENLPVGTPGKEPIERVRNYAASVAAAVEQRFPTAVLARRLAHDAELALPHQSDVVEFLDAHPDFLLATTPIKKFVAEQPTRPVSKDVVNQLEAMQRIAHVAPGYDQMRSLLATGIDSSRKILTHSPQSFIARYATQLGGESAAAGVYDAAAQKIGMTSSLFVDVRTSITGIQPRVLPQSPAPDSIPDLATLFGSLDYCACVECRSVLSPAAYLVDLLEFLDHREIRDALLRRRPDLGEIELTCDNTNTPVAYIDLVNEVLENAVAPIVTATDWGHLPLPADKHERFQTRHSKEQLSIYPEHLHLGAYATLRDAVYPWSLPFDLWAQETRVYLDQLGTLRRELIEVIRPPAAAGDPSAIAIACDTLGLTSHQWTLIADTTAPTVRACWGGATVAMVSPLRMFLERTGLTPAELTELLATRYINANRAAPTVAVEPPESCDLDELRVTGLNDAVLDKIHRFVRLWRALAGSMADLDRAIQLLGGGVLDATLLLRLASCSLLRSRLGLSLAQVSSLFGRLDTDGETALYRTVFWNPALQAQGVDRAFDPALLIATANATETISGHAAAILAALGLGRSDLDALVGELDGDARLTLESLSFLYRHVIFARALRLSIPELLLLKRLTGIDPFEPSTTSAIRFIEVVATLAAAGVDLDALTFLLLPESVRSPLAPSADEIVRALDQLRTRLRKVRESAIAPDPEDLRARGVVIQSLSETLATPPDLIGLLLATYLRSYAQPSQPMLADFLEPGFATATSLAAIAAFRLLHKMSVVVSKHALTAAELGWLFEDTAGGIALRVLAGVEQPGWSAPAGFEVYARLLELVRLRDRFGTAALTTLFAATDATTPVRATIAAALAGAFRCKANDVDVLLTRWALAPAQVRDERQLARVEKGLDLLDRLQISADRAWSWANPSASVEQLPAIAEDMRQAVKARYALDQWLLIARPLRDRLREQQSAALVSYLLAHPAGHDWKQASDLYRHFLIDVEMCACQPSSRIRSAIGTVQLFVQRCLMNLEDGIQVDASRDSAWLQWEWMKNYRVWEANRQIFLFPENWIEPELRDDKTESFAAFESELLQNDLTEETAEDAFSRYFEKLDLVSRLEICALYRQPGDRSTLHVFGRTRGSPHVYFYRRQIRTADASSWTPWEKVDVDIEGDHLVPVVWNDRLYLFWPLFLEQSDRQPFTMPAANHAVPEPPKYTKTQLAWTQYKYDKWSPKTITREFVRLPPRAQVELFFHAEPTDGGDLQIRCQARTFAWYLASASASGIKAPYERDIGFVFSGSDGLVRLEPAIGGVFVRAIAGTHVEGQTFVEDEIGEGNAAKDAAGSFLIPIEPDPVQTDNDQAPSTELRLFRVVEPVAVRRDDRLVVATPVGQRALLRSLPVAAGTTNRFRVVVPPDQQLHPAELFYQDNTRTFFGQLVVDPELLRRIRAQIEAADPAERVALTVLLGLAAAGSAKFAFSPHYHPFVRMLKQRLNRDGTAGLLQRSVQVHPEQLGSSPVPFDFVRSYQPDPGYVSERVPIEDLDFSLAGAYAQYNWELFFHAPLMIATKLGKNQRFADAQRWFHTIFDPTDMSAEEKPQRYWRTRPFYETTHETYQRERIETLLSGSDELGAQVAAWRANPFDPYLVARTRTTAFQRAVVMKYLDNLIAWADQLFRQDSMEALDEATQLYVLAAEILGPRPQRIDRRATPAPQTYYQLEPVLDSFSNALVRLENLTPPTRRDAAVRVTDPPRASARPQLILVSDLYFCVPQNDKLLGYWDTVADRLFKLRHCMNLAGEARELPLFDAPIDPGMLTRARSTAADLRSVMQDLEAPLPQYRFSTMIAKAIELCGDVRGFGGAFLAALEKRDGEALARIRSTHEIAVMSQMRQIKNQQLADATLALEALQKSRAVVSAKRDHYAGLAFLNPTELQHLELMNRGVVMQQAALNLDLVANILHLIPNIKGAAPTSIGATFGGHNLGDALLAFSKYIGAQAAIEGSKGALSGALAGYERRAEEWQFQVQIATKELEQVDKQLASAEIRVDLARKDLDLHDLHTRQTQEVDTFLRSKHTNLELYDWMVGQLSAAYFQSYQLAYDMAKRAQRAYLFERGAMAPAMIEFGYWDSLKQGLLAGERLHLDLRRLETAYLEQNRRDHELTKQISLALLDPFALHLLRTRGGCTVTLPESLFDADHPGHFMRRIKSVAVTLPAVVGPYTSVNCRLTLQSSAVRVDPVLPRTSAGSGPRGYLAQPDMISDPRFRVDLGSVQSIATSRGHSDAGLFEVNFRDERYLPFEGAGAISTWTIDLDPRCNDFDLATLSDVVLELRYTARDGGQTLRDACLDDVIEAPAIAPRSRLFSARTDFADAWNGFLYPIDSNPGQALSLDLEASRFSFRAQQDPIAITELHVVLMLSKDAARSYGADHSGVVTFAITNPSGVVVTPAGHPLALEVSGDPQAGAVPGGMQRLRPTGGVGTWGLAVSQEAIDGLAEALKLPAVAGRPRRLSPDAFEDLLVFVVH